MKNAFLGLWALAFVLSACAAPTPPPSLPPQPSATLARYASATPPAPQTPSAPAVSPTPLPSLTPTPRTHVVRNEDTFFSIAWEYNVTLEALQNANPGVDSRFMTPGMTLIIPPSIGGTQTPGLPTPIPLETGALNCVAGSDGGVWCFWAVRGPQSGVVENVTAEIRLADAAGSQILTRTATLPLNLLPAGAWLPLAAFFPAPVPQPFQASAEIRTVLPVAAGDTRYLPVRLVDEQSRIAPDGLSAQVNGQVRLESSEGQAEIVWVAVIAWDAGGNIVGMRRWEAADPLSAVSAAPFSANVYSSGGRIARVELFAEAQP